jgi:hypothetical protein
VRTPSSLGTGYFNSELVFQIDRIHNGLPFVVVVCGRADFLSLASCGAFSTFLAIVFGDIAIGPISALLLCKVEELKYKDIAAIVDVPIGTMVDAKEPGFEVRPGSKLSNARRALVKVSWTTSSASASLWVYHNAWL